MGPMSPPLESVPEATTRSNPDHLGELDFIDLYIPIRAQGTARYNSAKIEVGKPPNCPVPTKFHNDIKALRTVVEKITKEDFSLTYGGIRYRGCRQHLVSGEEWVCLRKISQTVPTLEDIRIDPRLIPYFRAMGQGNGLILLCGATGQGKTTTANALLGDFLGRFGNVAITIEDPVEFPLAGERGNGGYCFQIEIDDDTGWAPALKRALRWHPRYILVGEIRTPAAAAQLLRAATSGHLVICTMHAGSIQKGLSALIQVAEAEMGDRAADVVAEALLAVMHQTLTGRGPDFNFLFLDNPDGDPLRNCLRSKKLFMLDSYIERQKIQMQNNIKIGTLSKD
jgi:twitching motility protein PilT